MATTDEEILSILGTRALSYIENNGYFNFGAKSGFINNLAGFVQHTTGPVEFLKNVEKTN